MSDTEYYPYFKNDLILPPTPNPSDDEEDIKPMRLVRRGTVSLADLIPVASEALKAKKRLHELLNDENNPPSTQDSPLARSLTKMKIAVKTLSIKEHFLINEWRRLVLQVPLDDSNINSLYRVENTNRTKGIVAWFEHKLNKNKLHLFEIEETVDILRRQKLRRSQSLPSSPPATRLSFLK